MDVNNINVLVLAYMGDNIYEYYVRKELIKRNISNVNDLQKEAVNYVSAVSQAKIITYLMDKQFFTEEEMDIIKRARNHKSKSHPKNCDIITYRYATALEALIGYLEMTNKKDRIEQIMEMILKGEK